LPSFDQDAHPDPLDVLTQTPSTDAPESHETCPLASSEADWLDFGAAVTEAGDFTGAGGVDAGAPDSATDVDSGPAVAGSGESPGQAILPEATE
jgi:hypothetical protein